MKKECESVRKSLHKYLHGHLFKYEQIRIERHLKKCALCSSEFQALKHSAETRKLLKDITPPEGVVQKVKAGVSSLSTLKKILYRPLWLAGIAGVIVLLYSYVYVPIRNYGSLEGIDTADASKTVTAPAASRPTSTTSAPPEGRKIEQAAPAPSAPQIDPLIVVIAAADERAAMQRINSVMRGYPLLKKKRFTHSVKQISGTMTARELLTFFNRIEDAGEITYSRSRLESYPAAQQLPFIVKLKAVPKAAPTPVPTPAPSAAASPAPSQAPKSEVQSGEQAAPQTAPAQ